MGLQIGHESLTVSTTALGFTAATVTPRARCALIINASTTDASVRWRADGTAPTSTSGSLLHPGMFFILRGEGNIRNIQFIRTGSNDATVTGAFFSDINDIAGYMHWSSVGSAGDPRIVPRGGTSTLADAASNAPSFLLESNGNPVAVIGRHFTFNGTTWDRIRGNIEGTALASAARTAETDSADITVYNNVGIMVFLDITVASGTGGLQTVVQLKDPVSGNYVNGNVWTAVTATGTRAHAHYPGAADAPAAAAGRISLADEQIVTRTMRIRVSPGDGSSYTYSVGYCLVV